MKEKKIFNTQDRSNPNTFIVYIRKEDLEDIQLFDKLIQTDKYILELKSQGKLSVRGIRSILIMRLVKLYNKSRMKNINEVIEEKAKVSEEEEE